jgi:hypothetical protein
VNDMFIPDFVVKGSAGGGWVHVSSGVLWQKLNFMLLPDSPSRVC